MHLMRSSQFGIWELSERDNRKIQTPPLTDLLHITTPRLQVIASTPAMVQSEINGDGELAVLLDACIADGWPCEYWDHPAMEWTLRAFESGSAAGGWGMWYFVLQPPHVSKRTLIGNGGFKGPPDDHDIVEIGYSVVPERRRRGLATEACRALMSWAWRDPRVQMIVAETFPKLIPSLGVMAKLGMQHIGAGSEPGAVRYGIQRDQFTS